MYAGANPRGLSVTHQTSIRSRRRALLRDGAKFISALPLALGSILARTHDRIESEDTTAVPNHRAGDAYHIRIQAASMQGDQSWPPSESNRDEDRAPNYVLAYSKGL